MNVLGYFKSVKTLVFDIDGVLTDGTVLLFENGLQARRMHTKDGFALQLAVRRGYNVIIISGAYSDPVLKRLQYLGLTEIFLAIKNKKAFLEEYFQEAGIDWSSVLYMGDDLPDTEVLAVCGLSCCPADAVPEVKKLSKYISPFAGGGGCVRDVVEKVLKLNDHWSYDPEVVSK
jgi:3-deoxy-D-manno-octulosonate 8-phosphate phosphatase (KDO 8-P phosphatase)